jgi:hypothetical protein
MAKLQCWEAYHHKLVCSLNENAIACLITNSILLCSEPASNKKKSKCLMFALGFVQMGPNQMCPETKKGNGALDFW